MLYGRLVHVGETFNTFADFWLRIAQKCVWRPGSGPGPLKDPEFLVTRLPIQRSRDVILRTRTRRRHSLQPPIIGKSDVIRGTGNYKTYRHAAVLEEDRAAAMANMHENVATFGCVILEIRQRTNTQTHRHTPSSQYSAPRRKHGLTCCAFSINFLNRRSRIHYLDI